MSMITAAGSPRSASLGLIGLDWGTSSLRSYAFDGRGEVVDRRELPWGIMNLPQASEDASDGARFERAFERACGDWLGAQPALEVLACGMVGSAQGWREAPYLKAPCSLDALARGLVDVERPGPGRLRIVPGLLLQGRVPDVMRGEETQVFGALELLRLQPDEQVWIGLPGTHSKWVLAGADGVQHFETFMTGEVYAALKGHTILGRTMAAGDHRDDDAFVRGLDAARAPAVRRGLLADLFGTRTLGLTGQLPGTAQADYLSGLLIGHELAGLCEVMRVHPSALRLAVVAVPGLARRYALALSHFGLPEPEMLEHATTQGLWRLAVSGGLVR